MQGGVGNGVDIFTLFLAALGFQSAGAEVIGGLFMALAGALSASRILAQGMVNNAAPLGVWGTIVTGVFVAIVTALFADTLFPDWPLQIPMAVGGFLSSFIAPFFLKVAAGISNRGDVVAGRLVDRALPDDRED